MNRTVENALRIIIAKSPAAMREAIDTFQALDAQRIAIQQQYNQVVQLALNDPQAEFTGEERAILAGNLAGSSPSILTGGDEGKRVFIMGLHLDDDEHADLPEPGRVIMLRVRLTGREHDVLEEAANQIGVSMSEYVRRRLFSQ